MIAEQENTQGSLVIAVDVLYIEFTLFHMRVSLSSAPVISFPIITAIPVRVPPISIPVAIPITRRRPIS